MLRQISKKMIGGVLVVAILLGTTACGQETSAGRSDEEVTGTAGNIFADGNVEGEPSSEVGGSLNSMSITVALPSKDIKMRQNNQWNDRLVKDINGYTGMDIEWIWYSSGTYYGQIEQDIITNEMADVILTDRSQTFFDAAEEGFFWDLGPYIDEYDNLATMTEITRLAGSYNGKMYGIVSSRGIQKGLGYRTDWLKNLNLEEPSDWESFCDMLYAFTYEDPDGNGVDDTVGLYLDAYDEQWDVMESWFGVPNVWGIDGNGDLIHKSRTERYLKAYAAFRDLYAQGLINSGSKGFVDFRDTEYAMVDGLTTSIGGSAIDVLSQFYSAQHSFIGQGITTEEELIINCQAYVDTGYGALCYPIYGGTTAYMLAVSTKRIKTEEQLRRVLQFLNDVNSAECYDLIAYGWEGESYAIADETGMLQDSWQWTTEQMNNGFAQFGRGDYVKIITEHVTEDNASKLYPSLMLDPMLQLESKLKEENEQNCVINYGYQFIPETYRNQGEELDAMLYDAEIQYITGEIDDAGFKAALDAWWEAGGEKMTEEINVLYHAAGY